MQEHQAELGSSLQHKQLQVLQAAEQFQPIATNLEKVGRLLGVHSDIARHVCRHAVTCAACILG